MSSRRGVLNIASRFCQVRNFNLPRSHIWPRWEEPRDKEHFLEVNAIPLNVRVSAVAIGSDITGRGSLFVEGEESEKFDVSASAENPGEEYAKAVESNLIWSVLRAFNYDQKTLSGLQVTHERTNEGKYKFSVSIAGDTPDATFNAANITTLLSPVRNWFGVTVVTSAAVNTVPDQTGSEDHLLKGLTAVLACQQSKFLAAAQEKKITVQQVEYEAEFEVDTRGFVHGASILGVYPKVRELFLKARVHTQATLQQVKEAGDLAGKNCKILESFKQDGTSVSVRWTK